MIPFNRLHSLKDIIEYAKLRDWCMDYLCTTCGSREFRSSINKLFDRTKLIEELRKLDSDFVGEITNRSAMLIILEDVNKFSFEELSKELEGTPSGSFLNKALKIEKDRNDNHLQRMILQQQNKKRSESKRAQKNIWGAIKRRDFSAINFLLAKDVNLAQKNANGIALELELRRIGIEKQHHE